MTAFKIEVQDAAVQTAFDRLIQAGRDPRPALGAIGEALYEISRRTFETGTDPWGRRWAPNTRATLEAFFDRRAGESKGMTHRRGPNKGRATSKGAAAIAGKRPLIGASQFLSAQSLNHDVDDASVIIGSSAIQAAIQHFGGTKADFPHLWGDIPSRMFLPASATEMAPVAVTAINDVIGDYLRDAWSN